MWELVFFIESLFLGVGLAMDAFSVSLANGLNEPNMKTRKMCFIAGVFGVFQGLMPLLGWVCVKTIVHIFCDFKKLIPWIALILLAFIGIKMLYDGIKHSEDEKPALTVGALFIQGIATSIDALSVGFTIAEYNFPMALVASLIIALVTFIICMCGIFLGKKFGTKFANRATILGGVILILIGIEIFVTGVF